ncbi:MAG: hypothetical protein DWB42_11040 [Chloroflexi bacterium]|nr:hypothetical protein [Chloroflexota bacterium]MDL1884631.1 hypothetical protein [Anaerolineae bacterium CFX8]
MLRLLCLLSLMLLAACGGSGQTDAPAANSPIDWDRSPGTVVFRADVEGGTPEDAFLARSEIPPCTVYGDNRVVWTNEIGPFETQVLWDKVGDEAIRNFVTILTINRQIYSYKAGSALEPAGPTTPVVETLTLFVNGLQHKTDAFAGWDLDYYRQITDACRQISVAPVLYEPTAAWVSALAVPYDPNAPVVAWDGAANNLSLAELAAGGERKWLTDRNVPVLWNILRTSPPRIQFLEGEERYYVALEVPNVTRSSPPAPQ